MSESRLFIIVPVVLLALGAGPLLAHAAAIETNSYAYVEATIVLGMPDGSQENIQLGGTAEVRVLFEGPSPGDAQDDNGNGRDEVDAEIVALSLLGNSGYLGTLRLSREPTQPSTGMFEELVNNIPGFLDLPPYAPSGRVDSFFDVFFEIEFMSMTMHTGDPHRMAGIFTSNPPAAGDVLAGIQNSMLLSENAEPTGFWIRVLELRLNPPVEVDEFREVFADVELRLPDGSSEVVAMNGAATIAALFGDQGLGSAEDGDQDGLDEVPTELVALSLAGNSENFGPITLGKHQESPASGVIEETLNVIPQWLDIPPFSPGGDANSFFDVFFTIELDERVLVVSDPLRVAGRVTLKPAGPEDEFSALEPVELVDARGLPTGFFLHIRKLIWGRMAAPAGVRDLPAQPAMFLDADPNPFNPRLQILFKVDRAGPAALRIYDLQGRLVRSVYEGWVETGDQHHSWQGDDSSGRALASGTYLLRLETASGTASRKVSLIR